MARRSAGILIVCIVPLFGPPFTQAATGIPISQKLRSQVPDGSSEVGSSEIMAQRDGMVDVQQYGAVGDGTADDTAAILAAIASVNAMGGGTVHFPQGTYNVDSAILAATQNGSIAITASNVTITGSGPESKIVLTGSSECGFLFARTVDNLCVQDLHFIGNGKGKPSNIAGSFIWYDNYGATAHHGGLYVDRCTIEDCNSGEWIDVHCYAGNYGIRDIQVRDCRFISYPGDIPLTGDSGTPASNIRIIGPSGTPSNYVEDIVISGNHSEATYIKNFLTLKNNGVRNATVYNNEVHNAGLGKATDGVGSYAFNYYSGVSHVNSYSNRIVSPWTCGFYAVGGSHLAFTDNVIVGQADTADSTLCTGAYGLGSCRDIIIQGGEISDCGIGIQIQPITRDSRILIDGVRIYNSGPHSILIRENARWRHSGGVTIMNCRITGGNVRIQRGAGKTRLGNLSIENNTLHDGQIYLYRDVYDVAITNNQVLATNQKTGLFCNGGEGISICGNRIIGPGTLVDSSYGIEFNRPVQNPSVISGNMISGFQHGFRSANVSANLRDNLFLDVGDRVDSTRSFDLSVDPPSTIPETTVSYWSCGQYIEDSRVTTSATTQGWLATGPAFGLGCTYTRAATGDMQKGADVITDVSNMGIYIPGCVVTLADAAAGPSVLTTVVQSWRVDYNKLTGRFLDGEEVEGRTSGGLANIDTDNRANQMTLIRVRCQAGAFLPGETIVGHTSGATAVAHSLALKVTDVCENPVDDAVLGVVRPTWTNTGFLSSVSDSCLDL